jgi:MFS superfamily sulfate permease-like transporter
MRSCFDAVVVVASMAAVGVVFGFLAGVVADMEALAVPMTAIIFVLTGAVFVLSGPARLPRTITFMGQAKILKGCNPR